ncbi:hypothetical protein KMZ32_16655 [Phycicoccus sp. MAQZ13P-2]|uniref:hypothetical protein n=1 Tax=Phycicoccus mangrovi TaxID=2840470 RepID=UPI001C002B72|nr:hypothetical protein [Phycicoccus mangrovi]MBT9257416.1 hypothetical protein [Phycicoccus mangrovi]MBT9275709.1 hypothetical protein [Phycicoccus mangrovi]
MGHLVVHLGAERVAFESGGLPRRRTPSRGARSSRGLSVSTIWTRCPSFTGQLGPLAAGTVYHERRSEREVVTRFVTTQAAADVDRAKQLSLGCDDLAVLDEVAPPS